MSDDLKVTFMDLKQIKPIEQLKIYRYNPVNTYKVDIDWDGYNTVYRAYVWVHDGGTSLLNEEFKDLEMARRRVYEEIEIFQTEGKLMCADCGKYIDYEENQGHRYFAGIYCQHCWDTKWKAIEAEETYN